MCSHLPELSHIDGPLRTRSVLTKRDLHCRPEKSSGKEGFIPGGMQDRRDAGIEECRKGGIQERRDAGEEGFRKGEIQERRYKERRDTGVALEVGCRKGWMQGRRDVQ